MEGFHVEKLKDPRFDLLSFTGKKLILNLVTVGDQVSPEDLIDFQRKCLADEIQVVNLWQDIWEAKKGPVMARMKSILGLNKRLHGRSTTIERISKPEADGFMDLYHIQGSVGARYCYALSYHGEHVAVATFSNKRKMVRRGAGYTSAELIRFATKDGFTVTGGLSKLIKYYLKQLAPNDLMSYADRDWSVGKAYLSSGFVLEGETGPADIYLDTDTLQRYFLHRLPVPDLQAYRKIFNTGNLKYVLYP